MRVQTLIPDLLAFIDSMLLKLESVAALVWQLKV